MSSSFDPVIGEPRVATEPACGLRGTPGAPLVVSNELRAAVWRPLSTRRSNRVYSGRGASKTDTWRRTKRTTRRARVSEPRAARPSDDRPILPPGTDSEGKDHIACRILAVDPFPIVHSGLEAVLEAIEGAEEVAHAGSLQEALLVARRVDPHVVLLEIGGACDDLEGELPRLLAEHAHTKVLVFSADDKPEHIRLALAAGADGYVHKAADVDELKRALRAVCNGERYLDPRLGARLAASPSPTALDELSARELEVLTLLALGYANKEVADRLHVSVRTVETHRASLMAKLRISTRRELVAEALRAGLLREDAPTLEERLRASRERRQALPGWSRGDGQEPGGRAVV